MAYDFATSDGSGREYSRETYGRSVTSGSGARRPGMKPGQPTPTPTFDPQSFAQASVAPDAPRIPNLTPGSPAPGDLTQRRTASGVADDPTYLDRVYAARENPQYSPEVQAARDAGPIFSGGGPRQSAGGPGGSYAGRLEGQVKAYGDMVGQDFQRQVGSMLGDLNGIGALRSGAVTSGMNDLTTNYGRQIGNYASQTATDAARLDQQEAEFGRSLAQRGSEFDRSLALDRDRFGADDKYRYANLASENSRFDRGLAEQGRQYDAGLFQQDKQYTGDSVFRFNEAQRDEADRQIERNFRNRQYADQQNASRKRGVGKLLGGLAGGAVGFFAGGPAGAIGGAKAGSSLFG